MSERTFLSTSWGEMAYLDSDGSGNPLIFLHGTGCDATDWKSVIEFLPDNLRSIALDFRGHGHSSVPTKPFTIGDLAADVLYLMDTIKVQQTILVGHSLGGMVAMEVVKDCAKVSGIVLLEGWTSLSSVHGAFKQDRFYGGLSKVKISEIQTKSEQTRNRFNPDVWSSFWRTVREFDGYSFLENAAIPIVEVFGGMGRNESTEQKLRIPPNPNIQVRWLQNAGHYLPHECPTAVADICNNFVETL